jgi:type II restriction/modification system DNA methylase subunit YeeA
VNGGLFAKKHWIPKFSAKSRKIIIECGELDWSKINPDIFGSMMQAVVHPGERGSLGMHYTSVPNILKIIGPLFLEPLKEEFEQDKENKTKLHDLLNRLGRIKFFDPACGSGNFLIISYKEIRRLEMRIIKQLGILPFSSIKLSHFYGIEIDDFAHEIAKLSLYLAQHQMNIEFKQEFGEINPTLPLKTGGSIICSNATEINWGDVCPRNEKDEIYILGNPPYLGARNQNKEQKNELRRVFVNGQEYKDVDYIACWLLKGADYIKNINAKLAFVSTNSITQGEQVALIWPHILQKDIEIDFAFRSFKWTNNAKYNAGVTCVIIGMRNMNPSKKTIYSGDRSFKVDNITPYLTSGKTVLVRGRKKPLAQIPPMVMGNMARDGGNLILTPSEKSNLLNNFPRALPYLRRLYGAQEFLKGIERWCIWITDNALTEAKTIEPILERIKKVYDFRITSKAKTTIAYASIPHKFAQRSQKDGNLIIIPRVSSERRLYIPFGFLDESSIVSDSAQVIYNAEAWIFGIISSQMHMVWVRAVAGRLKTDYRYSSALCYNTFPIPSLTTKQKDDISRHVYNVLEEREKYPEKTVSQLYDPNKMPPGLKEAHQGLDLAVERCYRSKPFTDDDERLEYLFKLYEQIINNDGVHHSE